MRKRKLFNPRVSEFVLISYTFAGDLFLIRPATKTLTEAICYRPIRNRTKAVSITAIVGISLALLTFILRVLARMTSGQFGIDDWAITAAIV